jgi:hypothetical protein
MSFKSSFNGIPFDEMLIFLEEKVLQYNTPSFISKDPVSIQPAIHQLKKEFFNVPHLERAKKHLPDPLTGSAAKKINILQCSF